MADVGGQRAIHEAPLGAALTMRNGRLLTRTTHADGDLSLQKTSRSTCDYTPHHRLPAVAMRQSPFDPATNHRRGPNTKADVHDLGRCKRAFGCEELRLCNEIPSIRWTLPNAQDRPSFAVYGSARGQLFQSESIRTLRLLHIHDQIMAQSLKPSCSIRKNFKAPFKLYNLLSIRLSNRIDNRLNEQWLFVQTGCTTGDNRLYRDLARCFPEL